MLSNSSHKLEVVNNTAWKNSDDQVRLAANASRALDLYGATYEPN